MDLGRLEGINRVGRLDISSRIAANWANRKVSICTGLAAAALGMGIVSKIYFENPFTYPDVEQILQGITLFGVGGIVAAEGVIYAAGRLFSSVERESRFGPAMVGLGATMLLAGGCCRFLDMPNGVASIIGGMTLSWYGLGMTLAEDIRPPVPHPHEYALLPQ